MTYTLKLKLLDYVSYQNLKKMKRKIDKAFLSSLFHQFVNMRLDYFPFFYSPRFAMRAT